MKQNHTQKLALTGLFAALSYVVFTFLQFKISLGGGDATSIHLGNAVVVLGALLLGGPLGGLAGAVGMAIGDLLDPIYIVYVPKTLVLKLCIGLIAGFVAHRIGHIRQRKERGQQMLWAADPGLERGRDAHQRRAVHGGGGAGVRRSAPRPGEGRTDGGRKGLTCTIN